MDILVVLTTLHYAFLCIYIQIRPEYSKKTFWFSWLSDVPRINPYGIAAIVCMIPMTVIHIVSRSGDPFTFFVMFVAGMAIMMEAAKLLCSWLGLTKPLEDK